MKRSTLLLTLLAACSNGGPLGQEDGIGAGTQPECVPNECLPDAMRYVNCLHTACDSLYQGCYGPDYANKVYKGAPCSSYQACIDACNCNTVCQTRCGDAPSSCLNCLSGPINQCIYQSQCQPTVCIETDAGSSSDASAGGCTELAACCDQLTDVTDRTQCISVYTSISSSGDSVCASVIPTFCP